MSDLHKTRMVDAASALVGRELAMFAVPETHFVNGNALRGPYPDGTQQVVFGLGCFWGAERKFWQQPGVWVTAVGYAGGYTRNPTYEEVCSGRTGHTEVVQVVFDPARVTFEQLLSVFFEAHDPTQGMRQGNDIGTQYRSAIFTTNTQQLDAAQAAAAAYAIALQAQGLGTVTTELGPLGDFWYAEDYHQQYLAKNPGGYCGLGGTGVRCVI